MNPIKPNIGTLDRYLRLSAGLIIFSSGITGRRSTFSRSLLTALGAVKIAEGITGWCPLVALTEGSGASSRPNTDRGNKRQHQSSTAQAESEGTNSSLHQSESLHSQEKTSRTESTSAANQTESGQSSQHSIEADEDESEKPSLAKSSDTQGKNEQGDEARRE